MVGIDERIEGLGLGPLGSELLVTDRDAERAARRSLRTQVARLERQLGDALIDSFPHGEPLPQVVSPYRGPRLLSLGELEELRDVLAGRLHRARARLAEIADFQDAKRVQLERMFLEPGRHKFTRISLADLGEQGCGVYEVRPRMGIVGMLAGWWHVKLSSGCPLPGPAATAAGA